MITFNRIRQRARGAVINWQFRLAVAQADRLLARHKRAPNPGYDELRSPVFLTVMALAVLVLVVDVSDAWQQLGAFIVALGEFVQHGA